jgi:hypothetical protein
LTHQFAAARNLDSLTVLGPHHNIAASHIEPNTDTGTDKTQTQTKHRHRQRQRHTQKHT